MAFRIHSRSKLPAPPGSDQPPPVDSSESGIALFMIIGAMTVLSVLVTEFVSIAQVNQRMAHDSLDSLQAVYLAKTGYKLSLLRLRAFGKVKEFVKGQKLPVPRAILDKIWSFPFQYPIPDSLPGMTMTDKDAVSKFQKASSLTGNFSANIESESARVNLNLILAPFSGASSPTPTPASVAGAGGSATGGNGAAGGNGAPNPAPSVAAYSEEEAQKGFGILLQDILTKKFDDDPDFAAEYRDTSVDDIKDGIFAWAIHGYQRKNLTGRELVTAKGAPFYSISELHMVYPIDDALYNVIAPNFTVSLTPGVNVNQIQETALSSLVPVMTPDERTAFFKFRDDPETGKAFDKEDDFFGYLKEGVELYKRSPTELDKLRESLAKRGIRIVVDESNFKITVQAKVNQAVRLLEAWVTVSEPDQSTPAAAKPPANGAVAGQPPGVGAPTDPNAANGAGKNSKSGLKVTFMRIL